VLQHAAEHRAAVESWFATQPSPRLNWALRAELLAMRDRDQELRRPAMARYRSGEPLDQALADELASVDHGNTARMHQIVAEYGWPGRSLVGPNGAQATWLLVQHADDDRAFQERCLALLEAAVAAGEAEPSELAYLTDRVRCGAGLPQRYGTQMREHEGRYIPHPIEDEPNVDARRATVGLGPLAEYVARFQS
jgi:hypothetical protein